MNKTLLIIPLLLLLLASCQKKEEKIQLPVENVYVMAIYYEFTGREYNSDLTHIEHRAVGVAEVSRNMTAKIIRDEKNHFSSESYLSADIHLSDSTKKSLIRLTEACQRDTIFRSEVEIAEINDDPTFVIVIEKEAGEYIFVYSERNADCPQYVDDVLDILLNYGNQEVENLVHLEKEEAEEMLDNKAKIFPKSFIQKSGVFPPPPPLKSTVKFVPPIILPDE